MIYSGDWAADYNNIARHINSSTKAIGVRNVQVGSNLLRAVCLGMYQDFPQSDGHANASAFKKVGAFVAHFMHHRPIKSSAPGYQVGGIESPDLNAVIAIDIAIISLEHSTIHQKGGAITTVSQPLYLSDHSYADLIDALSLGCEEPKHSYHMLAVYFEQLVYKTNRHCEYSAQNGGGGDPSKPRVYQAPVPYSVTDGDELGGL
jgi:hypothetical protein